MKNSSDFKIAILQFRANFCRGWGNPLMRCVVNIVSENEASDWTRGRHSCMLPVWVKKNKNKICCLMVSDSGKSKSKTPFIEYQMPCCLDF